MASSNPEAPTEQSNLAATTELIEFTLLVVTTLLEKYDQHSTEDLRAVIIYILRQINEIQFQMLR